MRKIFMLLSMSTMIVSISTPLMATGCRTYKFELDLSEVKKDQMFGYTTTYDIHPTHDVSKIKFSCTDPKVLEASWEDNKLVITPKNTGSTTLIITATDNDGNEIVKDIDIEVDSKIHEFINERTFSLKYLYFNDDSQKYLNETGTGWLFYHETDINKTHNDYTYYLLTNNHVASSFQHGLEIAKLHPEKKQFLGFAYQNWDEARTTTEIFNPNGNDENGSTCVYNKLTDNWTNTKEDKFCTLFTTYVSFVRNGVSRDFYRDLTICKIDLSDYANTPVGKNRLDKLNEYANKHNNKLIEFDDYSDLTTYNDLRTIYTGGFPFMCIDSSAGSIYPNYFIKFQSHIFNDCFPMIYENLDDVFNDFYKYAVNPTTGEEINSKVLYDATGEAHTCWRLSPDWTTINKSTERMLPFGKGASGSLALRASDPLNPDTYKATGIYWGWMFEEYPIFWFQPRFTPFTFAYGKNIPNDVEWNVITKFYESDAYNNWTQINDCCYPVT